METCTYPECTLPGTLLFNACRSSSYCSPICQTMDWSRHKESCESIVCHKVGMAYHNKVIDFLKARNFEQVIRCSDLALGKFNAMKKRPLEDVSLMLAFKCESLQNSGRFAESLQCAEEKYNLWAVARGPAHPSTIEASFYLVECLQLNKKVEDAHLFAHTIWEIIHTNNHVDNDIPGENVQDYIATAALLLASAIYRLDESGGLPPAERQKAGGEAVARARQSLEIRTRLYGAENGLVATAMSVLAEVLDHFTAYCNDEALRLHEQATVIYRLTLGNLSFNLASCINSQGVANYHRAQHTFNDLERYTAHLELALVHFSEAAEIYTAINHVDYADKALKCVHMVERDLQQARTLPAAAAVAATPVTRG